MRRVPGYDGGGVGIKLSQHFRMVMTSNGRATGESLSDVRPLIA